MRPFDDAARVGVKVIGFECIQRRPGDGGSIVVWLRFAAEPTCPKIDHDVMVFDAAYLIAGDRLEDTRYIADGDFDAAFFPYLALKASNQRFTDFQQAAGQSPCPCAWRTPPLHEQDAALWVEHGGRHPYQRCVRIATLHFFRSRRFRA